MRVLTMSWLLALTLFCLATPTNARATRKTQLPSATVVGTVYCHTCFQNDLSKFNHFISGALVSVECEGTYSSPRFRKQVKTDKHGKFKVKLPFSVTNHVKDINKCSVNLVRSNDANCAVAATARTSSLHLKSKEARTHIFSAGFFTFKPPTQPNICNQKPQIPNRPPARSSKQATHRKNSKDLLNQKTFFPFPPLIPNPFQPPPAILPPIIPSPPPSIFPPFFPSPPPSIFPPVFPTPPQPPPSIFPPIYPTPPQPPPSIFPPVYPTPPQPQPPPWIFPPIYPTPPQPQPPPSIFPPIYPTPPQPQPPPWIFPPIYPTPPQPQPPPSIYPPIYPTPPQLPPSIFPPIFPPIPGFSPPVKPPPPPPPPVFPFLPPGFPGVPPVATSSHSKETKHP